MLVYLYDWIQKFKGNGNIKQQKLQFLLSPEGWSFSEHITMYTFANGWRQWSKCFAQVQLQRVYVKMYMYRLLYFNS